MRFLKTKRVRIAAGLIAVVLLVAAAAGGYYVLRAKYISNNGIILTPTRDREVHSVTYYLQNDPSWSEDRIGETSRSLGGAGCLLSCLASAATDLGVTVTPAEMNKALTRVGGYSGADVIWYKIHEAIPAVNYTYSRIFTARTIENDLSRGLLPIVNVNYRGGGVSHWVLIVGAKDNEFLVYDPLNRDKNPIPLSTHGKVYAYRVLHRSVS